MGWVFIIQKLFSHGRPSPFIYLAFYPSLAGQDGRGRFRRGNRGQKSLRPKTSLPFIEGKHRRNPYQKKTSKVSPEFLSKELENQIRDLQKELAEIKKDQAVLRLQPCQGDSEIRGKDAKFDELDRRAKAINETIRDLTRKRQLLISESTIRGSN